DHSQKDAIADARRRFASSRPRRFQDRETRRRMIDVAPCDRLRDQIAIFVCPDDVGQQNWRQPAGNAKAAAIFFQKSVRLDTFQDRLELDALCALEIEMAGDVALAGLKPMFSDIGENRVAIE